MSRLISVVLPCHNEEKNITPLLTEIKKSIPRGYNYEIVFVDDGSTDSTRFVIEKLAKKDKKVRGIILHRNFGHQWALYAGIVKARGEAVITMDADFQHPPQAISKMVNGWMEGHDVIQMQKSDAESSKTTRSLAYKVWKWVSGGILIPGASDFRLIDRKVVDYLSYSEEREIFLRGITQIAASNPLVIKYKVGKRKFGKSSYTHKMFLNMFINGFISFSTFPIRIASIFGLILAFCSAAFLLTDILRAFITGRSIIQGYITIVLLILILNGFIIFYMGILGEYLGVIFREVKKRPKYIVEKEINFRK